MKLHICAHSHIGNSASVNEDQVFCNGFYRTDLEKGEFQYEGDIDIESLSVFAVFDGMGGMQQGEEASLRCAQLAKEYLDHAKEQQMYFDAVLLIEQMNEALQKTASSSEMGSTAVFAILKNRMLRVVNIGDSRAYLRRNHDLKQLSVDHTVEESNRRMAEELGVELQENALHKHALTQYVGVPETEFMIEPYVAKPLEISVGDALLLCSDGLTDKLEKSTILDILEKKIPLKRKVEDLLAETLLSPATDNISIILIEAAIS